MIRHIGGGITVGNVTAVINLVAVDRGMTVGNMMGMDKDMACYHLKDCEKRMTMNIDMLVTKGIITGNMIAVLVSM